MFSREQKKQWRRFYKEFLAKPLKEDPLEFSLADKRRIRWDVEGYKEYGIYDFGADCSDDEIEEWFDDNLKKRIPSYIYWDCSGMHFTMWLDWHRNPCGLVSFVHKVGIDI